MDRLSMSDICSITATSWSQRCATSRQVTSRHVTPCHVQFSQVSLVVVCSLAKY